MYWHLTSCFWNIPVSCVWGCIKSLRDSYTVYILSTLLKSHAAKRRRIWGSLEPFWGHLGTLFGPTWGYLGLLEAILGHLGRILGPRASKTPPGWLGPWPAFAVLDYFREVLAPQNGVIFRHDSEHVWFRKCVFWCDFCRDFGTSLLKTNDSLGDLKLIKIWASKES